MITIQDIHGLVRHGGAEFLNLKFKSAKTVSTDSRSVCSGKIFFALRGEKFDGHSFVVDVISKGAVCAVVDKRWFRENKEIAAKLPLVVVEDTGIVLGDLARIYRRKFDIPMIAVGGSNGKTTTKEMVARVLSRKFKILKTSGNHNNQIGVPLTIFELKKSYEAAVVEIGTNHFGEIERLCEVLEPNAGLITNIGREHLEFFKNLSGVRKEEGKLFEYLAKTKGTAFLNADDKNLAGMSKTLKRKFGYGFQSGSSVRRNLSGRLFGFDAMGCALFEIKYNGRTELIHLRVPGIDNAANALAAAAVGFHYGVSAVEIKKALETYKSYEKRMQIVKTGGVTILNDTYNSNPESTIAALRWLTMVRAKGKRIVVLGDMLELGESSKREHQKIGKEITGQKFDYLFTFGKLAREIAISADSSLETESFDDKQRLSGKLLETVSSGDFVLVKGSRGMKMEEVVSALVSRLQTGGAR